MKCEYRIEWRIFPTQGEIYSLNRARWAKKKKEEERKKNGEGCFTLFDTCDAVTNCMSGKPRSS